MLTELDGKQRDAVCLVGQRRTLNGWNASENDTTLAKVVILSAI
jgi:hypothetical protein